MFNFYCCFCCRHRFKDTHHRDRDYDHEHVNRDYGGREERGYSRDRDHNRGRHMREERDRDRDRDYPYYEHYDDRTRDKNLWGPPRGAPQQQPPDGYYPPEMQHPYANRYFNFYMFPDRTSKVVITCSFSFVYV